MPGSRRVLIRPAAEQGTLRDDLGEGLRTIGFERRATVLFRVSEDAVEALHVPWGGRDLVGLVAENPDAG